MLRIGDFSKLAKISIKTLRYYDKIGLLKPAMIDSSTQYRYYTVEQLETVRTISMYKDVGLSNDMISKLIYQKEDKHSMLQYQKQILIERAEDIKKALSTLEALLDNNQGQRYEARVVHLEKRLMCFSRGYIANVGCIHDFIKCCLAELKKTNPDVGFSEPDYCCIIYPDDGYRESNIFVEYAQSVDRMGKDTGIVKFRDIEPITAVSVLHRGGYDTLRDAYLYAIQWAAENGYEPCGEPRERYINGKWNVQSEAEWLTELQLPVNWRLK